MEIKKPSVMQDYLNGVMKGRKVVKTIKLFKDAKHLYEDSHCQLDDDTVMYEVYSYQEGNPNQIGNLNWGLTVLKPMNVNHECNMTRGHFHLNLQCSEIYFCLQGEGLLLYMDENEVCFAEEMCVGSIHHIDGKLAHRLINTSDEDLKVGACWSSLAGHDYERIEQNSFKVRIFKDDDEILIKEKR